MNLVPRMYRPIGAAGSASVSLAFIEFLRFEEILLKGAETGRRKASQLSLAQNNIVAALFQRTAVKGLPQFWQSISIIFVAFME